MRVATQSWRLAAATGHKTRRAPVIEAVAATDGIASGRALAAFADGIPHGRLADGLSAAPGASAAYLAQAIGQLWSGDDRTVPSGRAAAAYDRADGMAGMAVTVELPTARLSV